MDLITAFKSAKRNVYTEDTITNYMVDIRQFMDFASAMTGTTNQIATVKNANYLVCIEYFNDMIDKGYKEVTVNRKLESVTTFLDFCIKSEIIADNKMKGIDRMSTKHIKQKYDFLTKEEFDKLLEAIQNPVPGQKCVSFTVARDLLLYTLILTVGLRISEALKMELSQIHLDKRHIEVLGKGKKHRELPLNDSLITLYHVYMEERSRVYLDDGLEERLFVSVRGGVMTTKDSNRTLKKYCERAGIKTVSNHSLRHTCASNLTNKGAHVNDISELLGHENTVTTSRYMHSTMDNLRNIIGI